jgi:hypothetical protein
MHVAGFDVNLRGMLRPRVEKVADVTFSWIFATAEAASELLIHVQPSH